MTNLITLLIILLYTATNCFSQDNGYIAISFGSSTPIVDFASKNPNNNAAGFAKSGVIFDISFAYKLGNNFGITALIRGQANATDVESIAYQISQQNSGVSVTFSSKEWSIGGYMVGGYGSFPVSEKVSFETKAMFGFLLVTSPEITINFSGPGGTGWVKQNSSSSSTFAHLLSLGFKYNAGKRICLHTNFDYLGARPEFSNVESI